MTMTDWEDWLRKNDGNGFHQRTGPMVLINPCRVVAVRAQGGTCFTIVFSRKPERLNDFASLWDPDGAVGKELVAAGFIDSNGNARFDYGLEEPIHREAPEGGHEVQFVYRRNGR